MNAAGPMAPTAAEDAQLPPGLALPVGAPIVLTYLVSNPGSAPLRITSIRDDNATPATTADDFTPRPTCPATRTATAPARSRRGVALHLRLRRYHGRADAAAAAATACHENTVTVVAFDPAKSVSGRG